MQEALDIAGPGAMACNQVLYHLEERAIEHAVLPWCEQNDVAVVAYSPFGHSSFPDPQSRGGKVLEDIAGAHDASVRQVALAFLTRDASVFAIPKASSLKHTEDNAAAGELNLSADEVRRIDEVFARGKRPHSLPMI